MKEILKICLVLVLILSRGQTNGQNFNSTSKELGDFSGYPCSIKLKTGESINGILKSFVWNRLKIKKDNKIKIGLNSEEISSVIIYFFDKKNKKLAQKDTFIYENIAGMGLIQWLNPGFSDKMRVYSFITNEVVELKEEDEEGNTVKESVKNITSTKYFIIRSNANPVVLDNSNYRKVLKEIFADCPKMMTGFFDEKLRWNDIVRHIHMYGQLCR